MNQGSRISVAKIATAFSSLIGRVAAWPVDLKTMVLSLTFELSFCALTNESSQARG